MSGQSEEADYNLDRSREGVDTCKIDMAVKILDCEGRFLFCQVFWYTD
jgi:hypothetical protein